MEAIGTLRRVARQLLTKWSYPPYALSLRAARAAYFSDPGVAQPAVLRGGMPLHAAPP
jgi:hypothetical protein